MTGPLFLGIDTSNYKTSVAVVDCDRSVLFERSLYLHVDKGKRGLRQSEAFFMHSNRLPDFFKDVFDEIDPSCIASIGVSSRPRRVEGSYMPCFLAGINAAKEIGAALRVPVYEFSHQEGHAAAIIQSSIESSIDGIISRRDGSGNAGNPGDSGDDADRTLLFHLSGGTSEFLLCSPDDRGYSLEIVGGTRDISIGQLIDRAGVAMGYGFPAGMYLDRLASNFDAAGSSTSECSSPDGRNLYRQRLPGIVKPVKITDGYFNISGSEAQIMRALEAEKEASGLDAENDYYSALSCELFERIAGLLAAAAAELSAKYDVRRVYMAGGVASSTFIRDRISQYLCDYYRTGNKRKKSGVKSAEHLYNSNKMLPAIIFGEPALSGDNAVGTAFLAAGRFHAAAIPPQNADTFR